MWEISKQFSFCYGHRVAVQTLNCEYSLASKCSCRAMHGHQGEVIVYLKSDKLNDQSMVTDFKHVNWFKKFLDDTLDHKMILDIADPSLLHFYPDIVPHTTLADDKFFGSGENTEVSPILVEHKLEEITKNNSDDEILYWTVDMNHINISTHPEYIKEVYEGLVLVPFVPTSENLSKWLLEIVQEKMKLIDVKVSRVQFFETPKSQSNYYA